MAKQRRKIDTLHERKVGGLTAHQGGPAVLAGGPGMDFAKFLSELPRRTISPFFGAVGNEFDPLQT